MKRTFFYILSLLLLAACSDVIIVPDGGNGIDANSSITVKLALPLWEQSEVRSRSVTENALSGNVTVLFFDSGKAALGKESVTPKVEDTKYTITINAPKGTKYLHIVANAPSGSFATANDPATEATSVAIDGYLTYWGYADITSLLQTGATVTLIPDCARFVAESSVDGFTIGGIKLINTANKGYIAPAGWEYDYTTPNVADVAYSGTSGDYSSTTVYCFEAAAEKMRVIVKGTYGGVEGYYKAALIGGDGNEIAVLRNHSYTLKVTSVNHVGYSTEKAAERASEANIKVEVVDNESEIVNLTSDGKDLLGVSKDVTVEATATSATIKVFTTLSSAPEVKYDGFSWVTAHSSVSADVTESSTQKAGKLYTLTLTLTQNDESDQSRTAEVTIHSGQMSRVVKVTQSGADFSTEREIHRVASGTETTLNLKDLMMSVKGLYPQYNQGVVRHIGLHFEPFRTDIYFKIKKITGDETPSGNEYFTVSDGGDDYWKVELNTSLENYSSALWTSSFSIKNGKKTYNYPVYHCGLFHKVSEDEIYYYEVVKVKGKSGRVYNILDRNLGATRNDFYSPETSALESYRDACGGYFKITTAELVASKKENNLESSIVPSGYEIPYDEILEDLNILTEIATASNGDQYTRVYLATCGDSQIERIYLPLAGYYEDVEHKNTTHCNLWSKSLLAGTQGFSTGSAEYDYWYRYLDFVGSKQVISNMRFVTGSNGTSTGRYKTMPVRCIHP